MIQIRLNRVCELSLQLNSGILTSSHATAIALRSDLNIVAFVAVSQRNVVLLQLAVQSGAADSQHATRQRLVPASFLKNAQDGHPFQVGQSRRGDRRRVRSFAVL